jgi:NAD(P)-dependent dehydrogenase (short-subunit alcohol dehydrogenase family)
MTSMPERRMPGRHAFVTGGNRGIGRAIAQAFKRTGARVTITGRDAASLESAHAAGDADLALVADVTDPAAIEAALARSIAAHGPVDILVANAGAAESAPFLRAEPDAFRRMFEVNVMGVVHAIRAVLPGMAARRHGRIIAIASTAGLKGYAYVSAYVAAKHAVVGLVRALAQEVAGEGVTVNALCPGYTETDMVRTAARRIAEKTGRDEAAAISGMLRDSPLGRLVRPEEVAEACLFLASDAAAAVSGTTLVIAGGEI